MFAQLLLVYFSCFLDIELQHASLSIKKNSGKYRFAKMLSSCAICQSSCLCQGWLESFMCRPYTIFYRYFYPGYYYSCSFFSFFCWTGFVFCLFLYVISPFFTSRLPFVGIFGWRIAQHGLVSAWYISFFVCLSMSFFLSVCVSCLPKLFFVCRRYYWCCS